MERRAFSQTLHPSRSWMHRVLETVVRGPLGAPDMLLENYSQICEHLLRSALESNFGGRVASSTTQPAARPARATGPSLRRIGYNARVDRLDAIRLLKALVAAGAKPRAPMDRAWVDKIAVRDVSLHGTELASALAYAEGTTLARRQPNKKRLVLSHSYG